MLNLQQITGLMDLLMTHCSCQDVSISISLSLSPDTQPSSHPLLPYCQRQPFHASPVRWHLKKDNVIVSQHTVRSVDEERVLSSYLKRGAFQKGTAVLNTVNIHFCQHLLYQLHQLIGPFTLMGCFKFFNATNNILREMSHIQVLVLWQSH